MAFQFYFKFSNAQERGETLVPSLSLPASLCSQDARSIQLGAFGWMGRCRYPPFRGGPHTTHKLRSSLMCIDDAIGPKVRVQLDG